MPPTPDRMREIDCLVTRFNDDWYLDLSTVEIRHKPIPWFAEILELVWRRKHSVFSMYWFFKKDRLQNEDSRKFHFPLKHDNIPVKGVPMKYELMGSWSIPKNDLKYLYGGPLTDQSGLLLVPPDQGFKKFVRIFVPFAKIVGAIIGLIGAFLRYKNELITLFNKFV